MDIKKVANNFSVAGQIAPDDVEFLVAQGFVSIICNRPDDEEPGQPSSETIREACERQGVAFYWIPVDGAILSPESVAAFRYALDASAGPVLGFCRSGGRSAMLWQIVSQSGE